MKISFCGHGDIYSQLETIEQNLTHIINDLKETDITFYLGEYGSFDFLCRKCCIALKHKFKRCKIIFVTPYFDNKYLKSKPLNLFDDIIFPPLEHVPKKFAILARNKWIVDNSDLIIAYVNRSFGGAAKTLEYAVKKKKQIINLTQKPSN